jgi:hypothetical protein
MKQVGGCEQPVGKVFSTPWAAPEIASPPGRASFVWQVSHRPFCVALQVHRAFQNQLPTPR